MLFRSRLFGEPMTATDFQGLLQAQARGQNFLARVVAGGRRATPRVAS